MFSLINVEREEHKYILSLSFLNEFCKLKPSILTFWPYPMLTNQIILFENYSTCEEKTAKLARI